MHLQSSFLNRAAAIRILSLLCFFVVSACASRSSLPAFEELEAAYQNAVKDAALAEPDEINRELTAITQYNQDLTWQGTPGASKVLVVTWTDYDGYEKQVDELVQLPVSCWVTVVPELREFCRSAGNKGENRLLRLKQLLGLPPGSEKKFFVEMWVSPSDLFRPSPDPEITDHEAELDFPESQRFLSVSSAHRQWFDDLKSNSYSAGGYPWTRLGYTYDWGNPQSEVGLSEFVIRKEAVVSIKSVSTIDGYCR